MDVTSQVEQESPSLPGRVYDLGVTLCLWLYFTLGFVFFYAPRLFPAMVRTHEREAGFQLIIHLFYRRFFRILHALAPAHAWRIDPDVKRIRGGIVVCNHLSYLDPLLLMSLFAKHKTVVKAIFFTLPIFGSVVRAAGYFPAPGKAGSAEIMIRQMETLPAFFASGGVLFIFPQGTRSSEPDTPLQPGALKIARLCGVPLYVLRVAGTEQLFPTGRFLFQPRQKNTIRLELLEQVDGRTCTRSSADALNRRIRHLYATPAPEVLP